LKEYFKERVDKKFHDRLSKVDPQQKQDVINVKLIEDQREEIFKAFEEELKNLELKYDKLLCEVTQKKIEKMESKETFSNFWLRVLSNHKIIKEFIAEEDKEALKYLNNLKSEKLEDGNVFFIINLVI